VADLLTIHQDPEVARWLGPYREADVQRKAAEFADGWARDGISKWVAYDRETGELVGRGGLAYAQVDGARRLEIGWTVRHAKVGQGYASEIGQVGLAVAFEELGADEVVAFTEPHNERSRAVMDRLGMRYLRDIIHDSKPFVLYGLSFGDHHRRPQRSPSDASAACGHR
jgi:RimJ/RimL family protein N-acetyltransferase